VSAAPELKCISLGETDLRFAAGDFIKVVQ
jgi:hypothetical protein